MFLQLKNISLCAADTDYNQLGISVIKHTPTTCLCLCLPMIHRHRMIFDNPEEEIHTGILLPLLCFIIIIAITDGALGKSKAYSLHIVLLVAQK